ERRTIECIEFAVCSWELGVGSWQLALGSGLATGSLQVCWFKKKLFLRLSTVGPGPSANCQLPTANCELPTANCQLPPRVPSTSSAGAMRQPAPPHRLPEHRTIVMRTVI